MNAARLGLVAAVVAAIVAISSIWSGSPATVRTSALDRSVASVGSPDALSSTWFCAAGGTETAPAARHYLYLTNPGEDATEAHLSAYGTKGLVGELNVAVAGRSLKALEVGKAFSKANLSVMVESVAGNLAVEHALIRGTSADQVPCATTSSDSWYFPTQSSVLGTGVRLFLFNPFSADAGVDISAGVVDGIRSPSEWSGIVVAAGTTRVIDLSQFVQRRDQFSVSVTLRTGQVVAETVQTFDTDKTKDSPALSGMVLTPGVSQPRTSWTLPGGFADASAHENIVVQNPGSDTRSVTVQVVPYGGAEMPPEPFDLDVPPGRYTSLDLSAEGRIPATGFHSIRVESAHDAPVVVARQLHVTGAPAKSVEGSASRPEVLGSSTTIASPLTSKRWMLAAVTTGATPHPVAFVTNPGDGIVRVDVRATTGGAKAVELLDDAEVPAGDSLAVDLTAQGLDARAVRYYEVTASGPVVVGRLATFGAGTDFSISAALPVAH